MAHTIRNKQKLLSRVRRIRGQIEAVERALDLERDCFTILQTVAACRGAINGLTAEIIEDHIRYHLLRPAPQDPDAQAKAAEQLIDVVRAYLK